MRSMMIYGAVIASILGTSGTALACGPGMGRMQMQGQQGGHGMGQCMMGQCMTGQHMGGHHMGAMAMNLQDAQALPDKQEQAQPEPAPAEHQHPAAESGSK
jgi:hypothetical protein